MVDEAFVTSYITSTFKDVESDVNFGYTFFYNDDHMHAFATIASTANEYEKISALDRPGVYRLNIGLSRETFQSMTGKGKVDVSPYDFIARTRSCRIPNIHRSFSSACFPQAKRPLRKSARCLPKPMTSP